MPELSIVIPVYNEEGLIETNTKKIITFLDEHNLDFEILFGNDGSGDNTSNIIKKMIKKDNRIKLYDYPINEGRGSVLKKTFPHCKGVILIYIDADLEIDVSYIPKLLASLERVDIAIASKVGGKRSFKRNFLSSGYNTMVKFLLGSKLRDHQGGLKAFKRDVLFHILPEVIDNGWVWDTEILVRAQKKGYEVAELPVVAFPKRKSKVNFFSDALKMVKGVLNLYRRGVKLE